MNEAVKSDDTYSSDYINEEDSENTDNVVNQDTAEYIAHSVEKAEDGTTQMSLTFIPHESDCAIVIPFIVDTTELAGNIASAAFLLLGRKKTNK